MAFAKLYGEGDNQVLVKLDEGEEGPEVRYYFQPPDLGVCSVAAVFPDTDEGWDRAQAAFDRTTEEIARRVVEEQNSQIISRLQADRP